MMPQDKAAFAQLMLTSANKYHREVTDDLLEVYWHCLKHCSLPDIQHAFIAHFQNPDNGHFMPQPSDIIRILQGDSQTQALEAWSKVQQAIARVGAYHSIIFDDFRIHSVIAAMGGWISLCRQSQEELTFRGHEFQKRYRGYLQRSPQHYPNRLIGIFEHQNHRQGYTLPPPHLFGNEQAAMITYTQGCEPQQLSAQQVRLLNEVLSAVSLRHHAQLENAMTQHDKPTTRVNPKVAHDTPYQPTTNSDNAITPHTKQSGDNDNE